MRRSLALETPETKLRQGLKTGKLRKSFSRNPGSIKEFVDWHAHTEEGREGKGKCIPPQRNE